MKRFLSLILVLACLCAVAAAEPMELVSIEDLQAQAAAIQAEILRIAGEPFSIWPGQYIIGEDIPAGVYRVEIQSGGAGWFYVYARPGDEYPIYEGTLSTYEDVGAPIIGKITLTEGMFLDVSVEVTLSFYTGVKR